MRKFILFSIFILLTGCKSLEGHMWSQVTPEEQKQYDRNYVATAQSPIQPSA
jgi:hypothetical protein